MRIYVAGASGDRHTIGPLIESLPKYGCTGYNWTNHPGYDRPELKNPVAIAGKSEAEINVADGLILYVSDKPSPGAIGETFLAFQGGLPIVVLVATEGKIYGPECHAKRLQDLIPPENIWAAWFAASHPTVATFPEALAKVAGPGIYDPQVEIAAEDVPQ